MTTIVNDADVQLQATSPRLITITMPSNTVVDFSAVTGATKPANNADVTTTILTASGTSIVMTNSQLFKSSSGVGGVFIGSGGLVGKDGSGNTTFSIDATTGAVSFVGSITGGSTLNITGSAQFGGALSQSITLAGGAVTRTVAVVGNSGLTANFGAAFYGGSAGVGVYGIAGAGSTLLPSYGVYGYGTSGTVGGTSGVIGIGAGTGGHGVMGQAAGANGVAVYAYHTGGGTALTVNGNLEFTNANSTGASLATLATNKPGSASTFTWIPCTVNGVSGWIPWAPN